MESLLNATIKDNKRNLTITEELYILKGEKQPNGTIATRPNMWYKYTCNICGWKDGESGCRFVFAIRGKRLPRKRFDNCRNSFPENFWLQAKSKR